MRSETANSDFNNGKFYRYHRGDRKGDPHIMVEDQVTSDRKVIRAPSYLDEMTPSERALHHYDLIGWIVTGIIKEGKCERNEKVEQLIGELDIALQQALRLYRVTN